MAFRRRVRIAALCVLSWICLAPICVDGSAKNVLFIVVDDLRPTLGCYGDSIMHTKNIDNLASKSIVFGQAYVQQAICGPSRISFLTSRRPDTTRLYDFFSYWRDHAGNYTTLPQHFKEHGYITQSVGKVFHPGRASNFTDDAKYSWTNTPYHPSTFKYKMAKVCPNKDGSLGMNIVCPVDVNQMPEKTLPDLQSADFAVNFLNNISMSGETKPFFLAVGFHKPHVPLKYPKDYLGLYPLSKIKLAPHHSIPLRLPLVSWNPWTDLRERDDVKALNVSFPFGPVPEHFQLLLRQSYYAATTYMDAQVGRVLAALEENGFANNTIISFVGDHGWSLGEHQEWSKFSLFGVATRVPLMISIPGITHSRPGEDGAQREKVFPFFDSLSDSKERQEEILSKQSVYNEKGMSLAVGTKSQQDQIFSKGTLVNSSNKDLIDNVAIVEILDPPYRTDAMVELVEIFPTLAEAAHLPTLPLCPEDPFKTWLCTEGASLMPLIRNVTQYGSERMEQVQDKKMGFNKVVREKYFGRDSLFSTTSIQRDDHKISNSTNRKINSPTLSLGFASEYKIHQHQKFSVKGSVNTVMDQKDDDVVYSAASKCDPNFVPYHYSLKSVDQYWKKAVFSQYPRPSVEPREDSDKPHLKRIRIMGYSMWTPDFRYTEWVGFTPSNYKIHWDENYGTELYLRTSDPDEAYNMALFDQCLHLVKEMSKRLHQGWRHALPVKLENSALESL
ncbi:hypothetical protein PoB_001050300 [Plakobranchus ocellatus]|uniref:Sulfatase N-terminal domain-containing protein n=1 Tax=Plakobranchus ocellatus TaxID=259542 RepID=A0AAV3YNT0_9GAST|nr:hypothetical protein PoB_001050300 [Plakobranchus ocellatus]